MSKKKRIYIQCDGGVVTSVFTDDEALADYEVYVVDFESGHLNWRTRDGDETDLGGPYSVEVSSDSVANIEGGHLFIPALSDEEARFLTEYLRENGTLDDELVGPDDRWRSIPAESLVRQAKLESGKQLPEGMDDRQAREWAIARLNETGRVVEMPDGRVLYWSQYHS